MKKVIAVMILFIIGIGLSNAKADVIKDGIAEAKYEIKAFNEETVPAVVADVKALPENTKTWLDSEVEKTKKFQKESWADAKKQTANTVNKIKGFFTGLNKKAE